MCASWRTSPGLWFIENNVSYRAFIADGKKPDKYNKGFYEAFAKGAGALGADFGSYLGGRPKMGRHARVAVHDGRRPGQSREGIVGRAVRAVRPQPARGVPPRGHRCRLGAELCRH